ncbi:MAG: TetR/AcrR family transcriptional regulator [Cellulomonas sp.]|nr:TetR/AcrR family transcriptional regulator [Cellulomonas sp.]
MVQTHRQARLDGRSERSRATRARVVTAASELFVREGYSATSIEALARAAGVGAQTVYYGFGTKKGVLAACLSAAIGDEGLRAVPVLERPTVRAVLAEPDPDLRIFRQVRATADVLGSAAGLLNIARAAAAFDPELAALWEDFDAERRAVLRALVGSLARDGALRAGVAPIAATDAAAVVLGPETWSALVTQRGWRALEWARWAHRQLAAELLGRLPDDVRP